MLHGLYSENCWCLGSFSCGAQDAPSHVVTLRGRRGKSEKEEYLTAKVMSTLRLTLTGF